MDRSQSALKDLQAAKARCRAQLRARLAAMTSAERRAQSRAICERVRDLPQYAEATAVLLYRPLATEVDVTPLWEDARASGCAAYFPRLQGRHCPLLFVRARNGSVWCKNSSGFEEPLSEEALTDDLVQHAAIVVPGLGFTPDGSRIGRGLGYYDRTLSAAPISGQGCRIGLAFEPQVVSHLPVSALDVRLHVVVTPRAAWVAGLPLPPGT